MVMARSRPTTAQQRLGPPQAFVSSYAPRIRTYGNSLLSPIQPPPNQLPALRTTKRGTTAYYAEEGFDDDDFEDSEGPRRPTGLRSLRRDETILDKGAVAFQYGRELSAPIEVQGIWRDWMGKPKRGLTEKQQQIQSTLPLTLIPIRIDLNIPSFRPEAPFPTPNNARDFGIDDNLPAYKQPEATPSYKLKDAFLWNLHEALMTPELFARVFVDELDFPIDRKQFLTGQITEQIRSQLEDYAGVALHPLFHSTTNRNSMNNGQHATSVNLVASQAQSPMPTPGSNPRSFSIGNGETSAAPTPPAIIAQAEPLPASSTDDIHSPDDTYRCIVNLNVNLLNKLYSDKFEWSLLHPPGLAEQFAKQTCADLGLAGEWVPSIAHAIYEAVLRLKKEVCENGGLLGYGGEIQNSAIQGTEAGWRYDPEFLADDWEPKVEILSKEEIEKREGDRERQLRRVRRETARYSSTANMVGGLPQTDYFAPYEGQDQPMGRGERSKKKKRFRSLSPTGRDTPDVALSGYGGGVALQDSERAQWRCHHCQVWGSAVWAVRDGPDGPKSLCHNCGLLYERDKKLPPWSKDMFAGGRMNVPR